LAKTPGGREMIVDATSLPLVASDRIVAFFGAADQTVGSAPPAR